MSRRIRERERESERERVRERGGREILSAPIWKTSIDELRRAASLLTRANTVINPATRAARSRNRGIESRVSIAGRPRVISEEEEEEEEGGREGGRAINPSRCGGYVNGHLAGPPATFLWTRACTRESAAFLFSPVRGSRELGGTGGFVCTC
jgi:hypothetical protein